MNKRQMKPIAYEIAARILERAIDNGEYIELSAMDYIASHRDDARLCECLNDILRTLDKRGISEGKPHQRRKKG